MRGIARAALSVLNLVLALIILFEEWGWQQLVNLVARLRQFSPWARFEGWIEALSPYPALIVLALPSLAILPIKLLAVYFLARGDLLAAAVVLGAAKLIGTAFIGRLFVLTRPAILRISWVAAFYNTIVPWQEAMFASLRATWLWRASRVVQRRVRQFIASLRQQWEIWRNIAAGRLGSWREAARAGMSRLLHRGSSHP